MAQPSYGPAATPIEVIPVVVVSQVFPARPSSIPDIRDFVRRCLAESPLTEEGTREVGETVFRALLDAAGPTGSIQVAFRIFPEHVEVDVLHSDTAIQSPVVPGPPVTYAQPATTGQPVGSGQPGRAAPAKLAPASGPVAGGPEAGGPVVGETVAGGTDGGRPPATFAEWMSSALRREGLTQEAAARQLGVSVKTVSRWVGGATEPRMRDLRRIQEVFGEVPLP
ncbi:MAG TPA: helix-turn-helix transcriptional regulator [Streptosporangiaceae bacterium]|nr:helix-turn-helix transcriptional regulator [Streptosporangiaceae bacterium]